MPIDHKRINGPEITLPYTLFEIHKPPKPPLRTDRKRADGRTSQEHRKIFLKTDVISQAKGSAYIELCDTKVIVSVFDPREVPNKNDYSAKGIVFCEFKYAPFSCPKRRLHQQDAEELQLSAIMRQALEATVVRHEFPNLQVDIFALCIHNDGSALSAAITAAGAALAHAGIPLYDTISSVTAAIYGDKLLVDPTLEEIEYATNPQRYVGAGDFRGSHGVITLSLLSNTEQVTQFYQMGNLTLESITSGVKVLEAQSGEVSMLVKKCLVGHVIKTLKNSVEP